MAFFHILTKPVNTFLSENLRNNEARCNVGLFLDVKREALSYVIRFADECKNCA